MIFDCELLCLPAVWVLYDIGSHFGGFDYLPVTVHLVELCESGANCAH